MENDTKSLEDLEQELRSEEASQDKGVQTDGTESTNDAADSNNSDGQQVEDPEKLKAELETTRKEMAKVEMERNLLRNKQKEAEREALEKVDKTKLDELSAAYDKLLAEKDEREAKEAEDQELKQANEFRTSLIAQRPEKVQKAAKALIEKNPTNLAWSNARDEADAAAQLNAQLDALESVLGVEQTSQEQQEHVEETPVVHPNNPGNRGAEQPTFKTLAEEVAYMEKTLPWADPR